MYATQPNGIMAFYREAGSSSNPTILLLHGFPSSSHQYQKLIPILSTKYNVLAPDLPGFGFTEVPANIDFKHTFANFATTIGTSLDVLKIEKFAVYVFDYGAPIGFRLALERFNASAAIITQNGNAYEEGLSSLWDTLKQLWQYLNGEPGPKKIDDPAAYYLDYALLSRPGNKEIQLDIFRDYGTNVSLYLEFQQFMRDSGVPVLAVWGKNDVIFPPAGAEAFKRDAKDFKLVLLDGGHFLVESHSAEMRKLMLELLAERGIDARTLG